jgi:EAL and modified HD-GYP domain-containing signal transduction protein
MLLGERGVRRWISLVAIACMGEDKPQELLLLPLVRARFCELLAPLADQDDAANDLFLVGLLSAIDAILDMKMEEILREITVGAEIRDALLGNQNALRQIFDVTLLYERAAWSELDAAVARLAIAPEAVADLYVKSMEWAASVLAGEEVTADKPA